jgi:histidinol phosphatase-like enzyme
MAWPIAATPTVSTSATTMPNTRITCAAIPNRTAACMSAMPYVSMRARGLMEIEVKNHFAIGDRLESVHPAGNHSWQLTRMENAAGKPVEVAPGSGYRVWVELPERCRGAFIARYV